MRNLKTALWFVGFALALQTIFIFVTTIPSILDPQNHPSSGSYHLVHWSMLCTLAVWIVLRTAEDYDKLVRSKPPHRVVMSQVSAMRR